LLLFVCSNLTGVPYGRFTDKSADWQINSRICCHSRSFRGNRYQQGTIQQFGNILLCRYVTGPLLPFQLRTCLTIS
jgi:hypothetical protein